MKITAIDQRKWNFEDGLVDVVLQKIKRIVILAGTNGSGKTRLLKRIEGVHTHSLGEPDNRILQHHKLSADGKFLRPEVNYQSIKRFALGVETEPPRTKSHQNPAPSIMVVPFVSRKLELRDSYAVSPLESLKLAEKAEAPGADHLADSCVAYIQRCQGRFWESSHPQSRMPDPEKQEYAQQYYDLQHLIRLVLQAELDRNADGIATLFGRPIPRADLSSGQRALLQWCVGLHAQRTKLDDIVLTMDEPENHLHPEALNATIGRIIDANSTGQVWIGTHSVPLIAYLFHNYSDDISLYFMERGKAHFSGRSPEKILTSLMGGESNIQALREFIDLPGVFATNRFAAECLLPPTVVSTVAPEDPQALVTGQALLAPRAPESPPSRLLDFGAGHGRLLDCLHAISGDTMRQELDYIAWDISDRPDPKCEAAIDRVYGSHENRWFNNLNDLAAAFGAGSFDVVIMCNVLHEIPPSEWPSLFAETGVIRSQLKPNGMLVIVEDYLMPKGEYAHPYGFIVLDTLTLNKLFGVTEQDAIRVINADGERYRDRIKAHVVLSSVLANVNGDRIKSCLEFAVSNAEEKIKKLRAQAFSQFRAGQAHAFWVQQYANASLARKAFA